MDQAKARILQVIWKEEPVTRKEVSEITGIRRERVGEIATRLKREGRIESQWIKVTEKKEQCYIIK